MQKRPVNLNLLTIHFPIPAIVSFLHRLSGLFIVLFIPLLLVLLQRSLKSEESFELLKITFTKGWFQVVLWMLLSAFFYHFFAGLRHLLMDMHFGESKLGGRISAFIVLGVALLTTLFAAVWITK